MTSKHYLYRIHFELNTQNLKKSNGCERGPDSTAEDSTAEDSTAELYLPTTLRRSFYQNADSTAELEKMRTLRRSFIYFYFYKSNNYKIGVHEYHENNITIMLTYMYEYSIIAQINYIQGGSKGSISFYVLGHCDHIFFMMICIF